MKSSIRHLITGFGLCLALVAQAAIPENDFEAANKFYEQGKFTEAADAYEKLIQSGANSTTVFFNLGDAFFKAGQLGRAIVAYRQAAQLSPRDADVLANLQFAQNQVSGPTLHIPRWQNWLNILSLNEWTWLTVAAFWLLFLLLVAIQLRPAWRRGLRVYLMGTGLLFVIFGAGLGFALVQHSGNKLAVVVTHDTVVRNGPFEESPNNFTAQDGAEFQILDAKDDWYQVSDGAGRIGWIKRQSAMVVPRT